MPTTKVENRQSAQSGTPEQKESPNSSVHPGLSTEDLELLAKKVYKLLRDEIRSTMERQGR